MKGTASATTPLWLKKERRTLEGNDFGSCIKDQYTAMLMTYTDDHTLYLNCLYDANAEEDEEE